jgi:hypothetical protein
MREGIRFASLYRPRESCGADRVEVPDTRSWPFTMTVARAGQRDDKPLLTLRGRLFYSGVMDALAVDAGVITVAAHLRDLQIREAPTCPESK